MTGALGFVLVLALGGQQVTSVEVRLVLPSFEIASGSIYVLDASSMMPIEPIARAGRRNEIVPEFRIENGLARLPTLTHDSVAVFSALELIRKRSGTHVKVLAAAGQPIRLTASAVSSPTAKELVLPYTSIISIEVKEATGEAAGETEVSVYSDNATMEVKTDQQGKAAILVEPGEYGVGLTGKSGYENIEISSEQPLEEVTVVLSKVR